MGVLSRRRWWVLAGACGTALATIAVVMRLPDRYSSEATLVAVQQQISQRYVEPGTNTTPAAAVQAMTRQVLSRSRLTGIIEELGLYAKERQEVPVEMLAERMQNEVEIEPLDDAGRNDFRAFKITFTAGSPQLAQATTSRLTSLFIEENLKTRGEQAARTSSFLTEQMEAAKKKLAEQSQRLQDFKMHNLNELPEQQQANLGTLTDLRIQLQTTAASLNRAQLQRTSLESTISGNLAVLQSERSNLLTRFTPRHAEVIKKDQEIARMQGLLEHLKTGTLSSTADTLPNDPAVAQWINQVDANTSETETLSREEQRLRGEIATYQDRMNLTPVREQQLAGILRDYDTYNKDYTDLQNKQLQSQLAVSLEERQEGQQFRLVDPPTLPAQAFKSEASQNKPRRGRCRYLPGLCAGVLDG